VLVSGDYKSATDNLPTEVAEAALDVILAHSVSVPESIKRYARAILRPRMFSVDQGLEFVPSVGQMMGSLLSFPLLCLQNYLAFRWARASVPSRLPLLINGDDILFQSDECFARHWMDVVASVGLEVERSKTSVSDSFGSLNSTLFRWRGEFLRVVPTVRMGMLRSFDYITGCGVAFSKFVEGLDPVVRYRAACCWFSYHVVKIRSSRLTLPELGFTGRLAMRMEEKFLLPSRLSLCSPPKPPVGHNVCLSSDSFSLVSAGSLGSEELEVNACEMVAWKWSVDYLPSRTKAGLRYCLQLSSIRPADVGQRISDALNLRSFLTQTGWKASEWRRCFFPRIIRDKEVICSDTLLLSQYTVPDFLPRYEWDGFSAPPSYEDSEAASVELCVA
jgi:hypothetical protein